MQGVKKDIKNRPKSLSYLCFKFITDEESTIIDDSDL
jgi:hypothetical protein